MTTMSNEEIYALSMNGIITLSDGLGSVIENGQIDSLNLAISGLTAVGSSMSIGQDLAVGNNIVNSGSIVTGRNIQCSTLKSQSLTIKNVAIRSDTQAQIDYLYNYLGITYPIPLTPFQQLLITKPPWARYSASSWVQATLTLTDETGNGRHAVGSGALTQITASGNGATEPIPYIQGITTDTILFPVGSIATTYTICGITRYSSSTVIKQQRILTSAFTQNVLIGHHGADIVKRGVVYNGDGAGGGWKTAQTNRPPTLDWLNICYTNSGTNVPPNNVLVNGVGFGVAMGGDGVVARLGINNGFYTSEYSDFQITQLIIWNQVLTEAELFIVSGAYNQFLATGILS